MPDKHAKKHALTPEMDRRKWKPGQSGNSKGRPAKKACLTSILAEYLEQPCFLKDNHGNPIFAVPDPKTGKLREITWEEAVVLATLINAVKGNAAAQREIWERIDGKVPLAVPESEKTEPVQVIISESFLPKGWKEQHPELCVDRHADSDSSARRAAKDDSGATV